MTEHTEKCLSYQSKTGLAFCGCDCFDKHVHEWYINRYGDVNCKGCKETMDDNEAETRLNEYETLKKATDALMVGIKDTHFLQGKNECLRKSVGKDCQICEAYADILEGKDG